MVSVLFRFFYVSNFLYRVTPKDWHNCFVRQILTEFQNCFINDQNQEKICNNTITKDPSHLKYVATLPCEMTSVLKATIENKTTSVTTHFKKVTTGNNMFIVPVIV